MSGQSGHLRWPRTDHGLWPTCQYLRPDSSFSVDLEFFNNLTTSKAHYGLVSAHRIMKWVIVCIEMEKDEITRKRLTIIFAAALYKYMWPPCRAINTMVPVCLLSWDS